MGLILASEPGLELLNHNSGSGFISECYCPLCPDFVGNPWLIDCNVSTNIRPIGN